MLPGRDPIAALVSHGVIRCLGAAKASFLNSHLPDVQRLAEAHARPAAPRNGDALPPDAGPPSDRILQTQVLPLLFSLISVGLVTAVLLLLDRDLGLSLVPIAYLIPVIVAAT